MAVVACDCSGLEAEQPRPLEPRNSLPEGCLSGRRPSEAPPLLVVRYACRHAPCSQLGIVIFSDPPAAEHAVALTPRSAKIGARARRRRRMSGCCDCIVTPAALPALLKKNRRREAPSTSTGR